MGKTDKKNPASVTVHDDGTVTFRLKTKKRRSVEYDGIKFKFEEGLVEFDETADGAFIEVSVAEVKVSHPEGATELTLRAGEVHPVGYGGYSIALKDLYYSHDKDRYRADFELTRLA